MELSELIEWLDLMDKCIDDGDVDALYGLVAELRERVEEGE